jgi:CheY-like chemotaxis protein
MSRHGHRIDARPEVDVARVLICDDTEIVRKALELAVRRMGHAAVSTSDPAEALAMARKDPPDLAVLDFRMPGMDGAELYLRMASSLGPRCPRLVFVSASPAEDVQTEISALGLAGNAVHVKKPFHLDELTRALRDSLA